MSIFTSVYTRIKKDSKYKIDKIIKDEDIYLQKKKFEEYSDYIDIVEKFIIKKKILIYGGYAINVLLPEKDKFYKDYNLNDFDCYSTNAKKDAYEIADIFYKKKYEYIEVKHAMHENTYRIYVNFLQVLDITQIPKDLYSKLYKITLNERETSIYKYYKDYDKFIVPAILLKRNLHYELARPADSYYRWDKIYNRLKLLNKLVKNKYNKGSINKKKYVPYPVEYKNIVKNVLKYIKKNEYPIIDNYAIKLYKRINKEDCCRIHPASNYLSILSKDYIKTANELIKLVENNIDKSIYKVHMLDRVLFTEIMNKRCRIVIENLTSGEKFTLINIVSTSKDCYSYIKINGYCVGSIDTILFFLYSIYIIYYIFNNDLKNNKILNETLYYISQYETLISKKYIKDVYERLSLKCYGNIIDKNDIKKKFWKKTSSLYRPENKL